MDARLQHGPRSSSTPPAHPPRHRHRVRGPRRAGRRQWAPLAARHRHRVRETAGAPTHRSRRRWPGVCSRADAGQRRRHRGGGDDAGRGRRHEPGLPGHPQTPRRPYRQQRRRVRGPNPSSMSTARAGALPSSPARTGCSNRKRDPQTRSTGTRETRPAHVFDDQFSGGPGSLCGSGWRRCCLRW
jgi:hypothetical protein